jgi:two-component system, sporulation sensor kinase E
MLCKGNLYKSDKYIIYEQVKAAIQMGKRFHKLFQTTLGKLFFAIFSALTLITGIVAYYDTRNERDLLYLRTQTELLEVATRLDSQIPTTFEQILADNKAQDLESAEQTKILNENLQPAVTAFSQQYPGVGLGIYSRQLDRNIAVGPVFDPSFLQKDTAPGALAIYETGKFTALHIQECILWDGKPILSVHYPIYRNGNIIGHTFANTKIEDIEAAYQASLVKREAWIIGTWLLVLAFISYIFIKLDNGRKKLIEELRSNRNTSDTISDFPEYIPVLETAIQLRKEIEERNSYITWVVTQINAGVIVIDRNARILLINDFARRYAGVRDSKLLLDQEYCDWVKKLGNVVGSSLLQALNGVTVRDTKVSAENGMIYMNTTPIYDPTSGEIVAAACCFSDITEGEEKNMLVRKTSQRLSQLIELCPIAILELDKEGHIVRLNTAVINHLNGYLPYTRKQLLGKTIQSVTAELGIDFEHTAIQKVFHGQEIRNEHIVLLDRQLILNAVPVLDPDDGEFAGVLAVYHDITKYENVKNEMSRLEYLNAIGETASSVAHELRNPATTVRGFVQMLSAKCKDEHRDYYSLILEELDRMNEIIENFLSLARNRYIAKAPLNLNNILKSLHPLLAADTLKNDIQLNYELCENIRILELNSKEIRQLVFNLARNAIEAMQPKGILTISTKNVTNGVELTISDTGTGIPPEVTENIFEPFYTSKPNGTGLGLAVSRNIVEGHNGTIQVRSEIGKGTTFTIYLPV